MYRRKSKNKNIQIICFIVNYLCYIVLYYTIQCNIQYNVQYTCFTYSSETMLLSLVAVKQVCCTLFCIVLFAKKKSSFVPSCKFLYFFSYVLHPSSLWKSSFRIYQGALIIPVSILFWKVCFILLLVSLQFFAFVYHTSTLFFRFVCVRKVYCVLPGMRISSGVSTFRLL